MEFKKIPDCISSKGYTYEISQDFIVRSISKKGVSKILKSEHTKGSKVNISGKSRQLYDLAREAGWPAAEWPEDEREWEELSHVSDIKQFRYRIFDTSEVHSMDQYGRVKIMTQTCDMTSGGYMSVSIAGNDLKVHQLMGMTRFVPMPAEADETWTIDHLYNNRKNNHADNLEWKSLSGQSKNRRQKEQSQIKSYPVIGTALDTIHINGNAIEKGYSKQFDSADDAAKQIDGKRRNISLCINDKRKSHAGFSWETPPNDVDLPGEMFYSVSLNPNYERLISLYGRIKYKFVCGYEKIVRAKNMITDRAQNETDTYPGLNINNKQLKFHRAVLGIIIDIPTNIVVDHIDDIKTNARLGNLQLLTQSENIKKRHLKSYTSSVASFIDKKHEISHTNKESAIEYVRHRGYPDASLAELNIELMFLKICDIPAVIYGRTWFPAHFVKC